MRITHSKIPLDTKPHIGLVLAKKKDDDEEMFVSKITRTNKLLARSVQTHWDNKIGSLTNASLKQTMVWKFSFFFVSFTI